MVSVATETPTLDEMVHRAEALAPRLRERAARTEQLRSVPPETIEDFLQAGLLRVLQPARYGGFELDYGRTQVRLCQVLGEADGSAAWIQCVLACHAWLVGMYPAGAQDAVWGVDPDTLIGSAFGSRTGRGRPVPGGYLLSGDWQFSSGSDHCQWTVLNTPIDDPSAAGEGPPRQLLCLLPRTDWQILDTWYAAGLKGSSSNDIRVDEAFVPTDFTLDLSQCDGRPTPGSEVNPSGLFRLPVWPIFPYNISTPALGIARGAVRAYVEYTASRPERANMPQRQLRISESAAEVDAAVALLEADSAQIARAIHDGEPLSIEFLARAGRDTSFAVQLCVRAVDRLAGSVGAHGMLEDTPIQRAFRDVHAVANHAANGWDTVALGYARNALGLAPVRPF